MNQSPFLRLFFRLKWRTANNHLEHMRRFMWIHLALGLFVLVLLIGGGAILFHLVFSFLMDQQPFGPPLMDRLIKMVLLAFFSMLIFSNLIIMLTTTYISREVEFLMSQPVGHRRLFFRQALRVDDLQFLGVYYPVVSFLHRIGALARFGLDFLHGVGGVGRALSGDSRHFGRGAGAGHHGLLSPAPACAVLRRAVCAGPDDGCGVHPPVGLLADLGIGLHRRAVAHDAFHGGR